MLQSLPMFYCFLSRDSHITFYCNLEWKFWKLVTFVVCLFIILKCVCTLSDHLSLISSDNSRFWAYRRLSTVVDCCRLLHININPTTSLTVQSVWCSIAGPAAVDHSLSDQKIHHCKALWLTLLPLWRRNGKMTWGFLFDVLLPGETLIKLVYLKMAGV